MEVYLMLSAFATTEFAPGSKFYCPNNATQIFLNESLNNNALFDYFCDGVAMVSQG